MDFSDSLHCLMITERETKLIQKSFEVCGRTVVEAVTPPEDKHM